MIRFSLHYLLLAIAVFTSMSCDIISLHSTNLGKIDFTKLPLSLILLGGYGRAAYVSTGDELTNSSRHYLYFDVSNPEKGTGRWLINDELGIHDKAIAYVDSWAVEPYLHDSVADFHAGSSHWKVIDSSDGEWHEDSSLQFVCKETKGGDQTFYFESSRLSPTLSGYYVRQKVIAPDGAGAFIAYSHVRNEVQGDNRHWKPLYLYKSKGKWLIGENVGKDSCYTFVEDEAVAPDQIISTEWNFMTQFLKEGEENADGEKELGWVVDEGKLYHKSSFPSANHINAFEAVHYARTVRFIPTGQEYQTLRNGLPIPSMGLGTGGLHPDETLETIITALHIGYRLFDLTRDNEAIFAEVLDLIKTDDTLPRRDEMFLESKVWPTELGFAATSDAVETSLEHLNTNYIDLYLLHWPECDPTVEWMHCEDVVDPNGTWQDSWRALERAYAEGRVLSIGVSNFTLALLDELYEMAVVKPHVVQNFAQPGDVDKGVRDWCRQHSVLFQPYASIRNIDALPEDVSESLHRIAANYNVSPQSVAIRFFLQSGAAVIPRSSQEKHLQENMETFSYALSEDEMRELGWYTSNEEL